jgi:catechol 2,3-dioxygenase-like lactoylglutathione lyase family enzyme
MRWIPLTIAAASLFAVQVEAAEKDFPRETIDLGIVVSDVDKAVEFYTKAVGFKELPGFAGPAKTVGDAGLTDYQPLAVRVVALGDEPTGTRLKLMAVPGVKTKTADNQFIHSQYGYRYLTIRVSDMKAAVERLKKAGVQPVGKCPLALPDSLGKGIFLTVFRDPDGNFLEFVGPSN